MSIDSVGCVKVDIGFLRAFCVGTLSGLWRAGRRSAGWTAHRQRLPNESLKETSRHQPCATSDARRQVVDVSSCALSDVNAYGCQSEEQGEFISPAKTERKRICKALTSKNVVRNQELEQLKAGRGRLSGFLHYIDRALIVIVKQEPFMTQRDAEAILKRYESDTFLFRGFPGSYKYRR
jgi:hypothetical protein